MRIFFHNKLHNNYHNQIQHLLPLLLILQVKLKKHNQKQIKVNLKYLLMIISLYKIELIQDMLETLITML